MISEQWLLDTNEEFRLAQILPAARPWRALEKYGNETKLPIAFSSPEANQIFTWFEKSMPPGTLNIRPRFVGAFYFDAHFWSFYIPVIFGRVAIEPLKLFTNIPKGTLFSMAQSPNDLTGYLSHWSECFDFAEGFSSIIDNASRDSFGSVLFKSGKAEIESAIVQITQVTPNTKAMMSSRMATEMFLKSLLAINRGLPETEARKISHHLDIAIDKCIELTGSEDLLAIKPKLGIFPEIADRYTGEEKPLIEIWEAYRLAQQVGATVKRLITHRDARPQFQIS